MEVALVSMWDKARMVLSRMLRDVGEFCECEVKTLMTHDHTAFQMRRSG